MIGPTITTTQAPSLNFTVAKMRTIRAVRKAEMAVDDHAAAPLRAPGRRGGA